MFTVISLPELKAPGIEFSRELASKAQHILLSSETSFEDAKVLCEYLDCVKAKIAGLNKAFAFTATRVLRAYLEDIATPQERAALARRSPTVKHMQLQAPAERVAPVLMREYA